MAPPPVCAKVSWRARLIHDYDGTFTFMPGQECLHDVGFPHHWRLIFGFYDITNMPVQCPVVHAAYIWELESRGILAPQRYRQDHSHCFAPGDDCHLGPRGSLGEIWP